MQPSTLRFSITYDASSAAYAARRRERSVALALTAPTPTNRSGESEGNEDRSNKAAFQMSDVPPRPTFTLLNMSWEVPDVV